MQLQNGFTYVCAVCALRRNGSSMSRPIFCTTEFPVSRTVPPKQQMHSKHSLNPWQATDFYGIPNPQKRGENQ